ncbi:MAG: hypothetical protein EBU06_03445 [Micrococcales bacterium]|nr:hypothetical protein [Micrococcales bacterium]NBR61527.1 hypothetical protein [Actinomycetota bacterium]NBS60856.1 hypothetical protein [Microbacteriaceae bacterium]NBT47592.1 hypothetical protein [Actinomycetota bacterium]
MKFLNRQGQAIGSSELGRLILSAAEPKLVSEIANVENWRKDYLKYFREVAKAELMSPRSALEVATQGLKVFEDAVHTDNNENLLEVITAAWRSNKDQVSMVVIKGTGVTKQPDFFEVTGLVKQHLAEPLVAEKLKSLDSGSLKNNLLIALAGGAEYSPARVWLDWGGATAIVARPRTELWAELISRARNSSGTLYVPVLKSRAQGLDVQNLTDAELAKIAGLDLVLDYEAIAGWLSMLARTETGGLVLGCYAYAPGVKHIEVQAVQHCLGRVMSEALPKSRLTLNWLATPTDAYAVPADIVEDINNRYSQRSPLIKLRDFVFGARQHIFECFETESGEMMAIMDATSVLQGPSYALAKRTQRWMAYQQLFSGRNVAYLVSPPAETKSVLNKKILRLTYAGAPAFGLDPFAVDQAVMVATGLLVGELDAPRSQNALSSYLDLAVHGGLWRVIYSPKSAWRAATILGAITLGF